MSLRFFPIEIFYIMQAHFIEWSFPSRRVLKIREKTKCIYAINSVKICKYLQFSIKMLLRFIVATFERVNRVFVSFAIIEISDEKNWKNEVNELARVLQVPFFNSVDFKTFG